MQKIKNKIPIVLVSCLAAFLLCFTACNPEPSTAAAIPELNGDVTITLNRAVVTSAQTGRQLAANYSGTDTDVTFQWNKDDTAIAHGGIGELYTPREPGNYTVTASATGYAPKTSAAVTVTGASLLALSGNVTITLNGTVTATAPTGRQLTATYSGTDTAVTFQWNKGETAITPDGTGTAYTPDEPGIYTVTASAAGYSSKPSAAVTVVWECLFPCDLPNHFYFDVSNSHAELLYSGCYDAVHRGPHRVEYILTKERVQAPSVTRPNVNFTNDRDGGVLRDMLLQHGFSLPVHSTYTGSGYDRGHMAPNGDFNDTEENATLTFFTGNIWPQTPHCNQVTWLATENRTRTLAVDYVEIKVVLIADEFSNKTVGPIQVPANFKRRVFDVATNELIYNIDIDHEL